MAIWQYDIIMVPKKAFSSVTFNNNNLLDDKIFDNTDFWSDYYKYKDFSKIFAKFLSISDSWSKDVKIFGSIEGTCLNVVLEGDAVKEITIRLDFREDNREFLQSIIEFAREKKMVLLDVKLKTLPFSYTKILDIIKNSDQVRKYFELMKATSKE